MKSLCFAPAPPLGRLLLGRALQLSRSFTSRDKVEGFACECSALRSCFGALWAKATALPVWSRRKPLALFGTGLTPWTTRTGRIVVPDVGRICGTDVFIDTFGRKPVSANAERSMDANRPPIAASGSLIVTVRETPLRSAIYRVAEGLRRKPPEGKMLSPLSRDWVFRAIR